MGRGFSRSRGTSAFTPKGQAPRSDSGATAAAQETVCAALTRAPQQDRPSESARGAGDKSSFAGSLRHPLMHRGHASFGHIAYFGGMGLQQFYNLGIAGGLDDGHAGVGDFDLGFNILMDVKKRI